VETVEEVLKAYRRALSVVSLKGPTCFAPSIQMAASFAADHFHKQEQKYYVLLIITDGKHFSYLLFLYKAIIAYHLYFVKKKIPN